MGATLYTVFANDRYELDVLRGETQYILILNIYQDECLELVDVLALIDGDYRAVLRHGFTLSAARNMWAQHLSELEAEQAHYRNDDDVCAEIERALLFHNHINQRR